MTTTAETRSDYIAGLRAIVEILEANPDLPLPYATGTTSAWDSDRLTFYVNTREQIQALAAALPGSKDKKVKPDSEHYGFELHGQVHGLYYLIAVDRKKVCRRVVTGVREITVDEPDPEALAAVPMITVTKTVEDVEWECGPLLAEQVSA